MKSKRQLNIYSSIKLETLLTENDFMNESDNYREWAYYTSES